MNSKGHLLVVDDEEIIIEIFHNLLEDKEYQVSYAKNGEEALKIVENDKHGFIKQMVEQLRLGVGWMQRERVSASARMTCLPGSAKPAR